MRGIAQRGAPPTFSREIAPILFARCAACHRPGEAAPMPLLSYEDVRPWARTIKEVVVTARMPPWPANAGASSRAFSNDRRLSEREIETIVAWVDGGAPKGRPADMPVAPTFTDGWTLGEPDLVVEMPVEYAIAAEGVIAMQNFYVAAPFKEDAWVQAVELRPGNRAAVHHSIVNVVERPGPTAAGSFKLVGQAPGNGAERYPEGLAKRIPAGRYFQFNMHYQPTGRAETDRSRLGIWFAKRPVHHEVHTQGVHQMIAVEGRQLVSRVIPNIPPHAGNWEIAGTMPVPEDITLLALSPHMHLRGKDIKYFLVSPGGREELLLDVPKYDFNWQLRYELAEPIKIPAGSQLKAVAHYDNSSRNPYNPSPDREVFWAEQSWDEMFIPWVEYIVDGKVLATKR